jgi:glycosyltransferase involved in cell wall biosynthesis
MASRFQDRAPTRPLVSVIIAAFNSGPLLCETVESALGQTWAHREIIVVEDGSTAAVDLVQL